MSPVLYWNIICYIFVDFVKCLQLIIYFFWQLVAGSGTSQAQDEAENAPIDDANVTVTAKDDGYGHAVPGPLTRLFVIANRGIANLIQDLILVSLVTLGTLYIIVTYDILNSDFKAKIYKNLYSF